VNTKQARAKIEEHIKVVSQEVWQDKPYTAVRIIAKVDDVEFDVVGFAKIQWPDTWDAAYGVRMASDKAVAKITKEVLNSPKWVVNESTECAG